MHGTLHRDVWEQFGNELAVGSVLVLRNMGVLSTGVSTRRHYLNITSNNLATIYSASQGEARVSHVHPLTKNDFMKTIEDWQRMISQAAFNSPVTSSPNPRLFNNVQPVASSPCSSLSSKPSNFLTNKLQTNAVNIRNLAKAFNNNQRPVNPATPSCSRVPSHNSFSSSVNNRNKQTFNQTPVFQSESEKFVPNSVPSNSSKINQLPFNNVSKNNHLKQIETNNSGYELSNKNYVSNNMNCSFDQQSVDMFASRENTQKSYYASHTNNVMNNLKNDRLNKNSFVTGKSESCAFQPKKPRFSDFRNTRTESSEQTINLSTSNITICSGTVTEDEKSVVASVLDGLDEDSLFSDDF